MVIEDMASSEFADIPIHNDDVGVSLSLADIPLSPRPPHRTTGSPRLTVQGIADPVRGRLRQRSYWSIALYTVIAVMLVIILFVSVPHDATSGPNPFRRIAVNLDDVIRYLDQRNISDYRALTTPNTPQYQAIQWLAKHDPGRISLPTTSVPDSEHYIYQARYVLAVLYFACEGDQWDSAANFLSPQSICEWHSIAPSRSRQNGVNRMQLRGVLCVDQVPTILDLQYNQLGGSIPTELGLLTTLKKMDLGMNGRIGGSIPSQLCGLTNLQELFLNSNDLNGQLPNCLDRLTALKIIQLADNDLTGKLSSRLCHLTQMELLSIEGNMISGSIPSCMGMWTNLISLKMSDNQLSGDLPTELQRLTNLRELFLDSNFLTGDPTPVWNSMTDLRLLYAEENRFNGTIDSMFLRNSSGIMAIDLSRNNFTNPREEGFPAHLLQMPRLRVLDLSGNVLQGHLPMVLTDNTELLFFSVHNNLLDGGIPAALQKLSAITHLDLSDNSFHGPLRKELFEMSSLQIFFLSNNPLLHEGPIPPGLDHMTQLREFSLRRTNRNGTLPDLLNFKALELADFGSNQLTGSIPTSYGKLPNIRHLLLNRNRLSGPVPEFDLAWNLQTLLVDGTNVTGDFTSLCSLPTFTDGQDHSIAESVVVADCGNDNDSAIICDCCHCCRPSTISTTSGGGCSDALIVALDWNWEYGFRYQVRELGLNLSLAFTT